MGYGFGVRGRKVNSRDCALASDLVRAPLCEGSERVDNNWIKVSFSLFFLQAFQFIFRLGVSGTILLSIILTIIFLLMGAGEPLTRSGFNTIDALSLIQYFMYARCAKCALSFYEEKINSQQVRWSV